MAANRSWKLKRFARFKSNTKDKTAIPWKVYDGNEKNSPVFLTILDSGYLLVTQGQTSLDTVHLTSSGDNTKVSQKSDNLIFRFTLKGESRLTRLQFQATNKEDAIKECASALKKVMEYLPDSCLEESLQPPNQTQTETGTQRGNDVRHEHQPVQGLLPIKKLAQYFLGDAALTLPQLYHYNHKTPVDFERILRVFLLDPSFHAFVEKVEGELKTLLQE